MRYDVLRAVEIALDLNSSNTVEVMAKSMHLNILGIAKRNRERVDDQEVLNRLFHSISFPLSIFVGQKGPCRARSL